MEAKKFNHDKKNLPEALGIGEIQMDKLVAWGALMSEKIVTDKITEVQLAEKVTEELTDEEIVMFATLFIQQMTENATKNIPPELLELLKGMGGVAKVGNMGIMHISKKEDLFKVLEKLGGKKMNFKKKDSGEEEEKRVPLSKRSNNNGVQED